jgi:branched-chain amino acid transport system substrate-binding protein
MLSTAYLKDPLDSTRYASDKGVQLFKDVMTQYGGALASPACPADGSDAFCVSGMASAYTLVWVLNKAQKDGQLTRQHVMDIECCNLKVSDDPLLLPGMVVYTSKSDHFPIRQMQIETWQADHWVLQGNLIDGRPGGTPK